MASYASQALATLAPRAGGENGLSRLNPRVVNTLLSWPGETVVVDKFFYEVKLRFCKGGYRVFDDKMQAVYSVLYDPSQMDAYGTSGPNILMTEVHFGRHPLDAVFMAARERGTLFFINYTQANGSQNDERIVAALISPVDGIEIKLPSARGLEVTF